MMLGGRSVGVAGDTSTVEVRAVVLGIWSVTFSKMGDRNIDIMVCVGWQRTFVDGGFRSCWFET